ncbi:recombinase family protein [Priestia sp. JV24]|uniref:recombinase family protein n=1 Tax=Priestia TaxID=2800373 RepID=UPI0021D67964|nr:MULTISPECIES: recombinase family protein [Priestia]MCU7708401.1 recombinase family protein [Priestia megaterium]MCW1048027.1 recombinase family protein [Priestia sp. JV24]
MREIKNVAMYLRLSRDEENQGIDTVLANHRKTLINFCNQNKWKYTVYQEIASSYDMVREKLTEMLEKVKQDEYDAVVVMDVDRLSRNDYDASVIFKTLSDSNTAIVTPDKIYNWDNDGDNLLLKIQSIVAAQEYKQIKKRMQRGKQFATEKGYWVHGTPPLGYDKNLKTRKLFPNDEAKHVQFIFNSIVDGKTVSDVYHALNKMGVKTRTNSKFAFNSIMRIVTNEAYKGTIVSNRYIAKDKQKPKSEWIYIDNAHEPIVDKQTWDRANKIVNTYSFSALRSKNKIYPTSKLIVCGNCGKVQGAQLAHTGKLYLKICSKCKNRSFLYEPILREIKKKIVERTPEVSAQINDIQQKSNTSEVEYKKQQIGERIQKATVALGKLLPLYEEDIIDLKQFKERKAHREQEIKELKYELQQVIQTDPKDKIADLQEMKKRIEYLLNNWECIDGEGLTDEQVNRSLHFIVECIKWTYPKGKDVEPKLEIIYKTK